MATISVGITSAGYIVAVAGRLKATDLRRLECACGSALEHKRVDLEIDIDDEQPLDPVVAAYLARLEARGAIVKVRGRRRTTA